jgi:hypothetical protein
MTKKIAVKKKPKPPTKVYSVRLNPERGRILREDVGPRGLEDLLDNFLFIKAILPPGKIRGA